MDNLPLVLVVVAIVAALVYVLFFRKKALPEDGAGKAASEARAAQSPESRKEGREGRQLGPTPKPPTPESIPSGHVFPDDSANVPAVIETTTAAPPVASKKDVAGLRKGLAATRGGFMARLKALLTGKKEIDPAILEQMEEVMISSDVGV